MRNWFRKKPDIEALAREVGQACVTAREIVSGFTNGNVFSPEETKTIIDMLPQALHALALHHLHLLVDLQKVEVSNENDPTMRALDQLYSGSKASMLKTAVDDSVTRSWLADWENLDVVLAALRAPEEADAEARRRYSEDFLVWKSSTDYWAQAPASSRLARIASGPETVITRST